MTLEPFEQVLLEGNSDAIAEFASNIQRCIIVDWGEDDVAIFEYARAKLPDDYLAYNFDGQKTFSVTCGGMTEQLELFLKAEDRYRVLRFINDMTYPDYEMRVFRCFYGGDTHSFLLRSIGWWTQFSSEFPDRCEELFIPIDETTKFQ